MTFCLGIKVTDGLVGLADTRIVKGSEQSSKGKISRLQHGTGEMFLMTSGLRSVRDKVCVYFEDRLAELDSGLKRVVDAGNLFGGELRRVRAEDGPALEGSGLTFNLHAILGGYLADDAEPELLYIYPEGNWVRATADAPYHVIGRTPYGRPILDRLLGPDTPLGQAAALAYLAFDATRASVTDVDFPIDVVVLDAASGRLRERRLDAQALAAARGWWHETLHGALREFPLEWAEELLGDAS